ncbi:MAG: TlpA family protein disulfide reductase [Dehalococcoidales bacterium]|nr:TlpA family protein disulfide reductase [Dehalococcoidales bacterium]
MSKTVRVILTVMLASLSLGLVIAGCSRDSAPPKAIVGQQAPDFQLPDIDGQMVSLSDFSGQPILINFWGTGCPPCISEMPSLQQVYEDTQGKELVMLAIHVGGNPTSVRQFMEEYNLSLPVLIDAKGTIAQQYNIRGIPTTFLIDKNGIIQEKLIGAFPNSAAITKRIAKIMP